MVKKRLRVLDVKTVWMPTFYLVKVIMVSPISGPFLCGLGVDIGSPVALVTWHGHIYSFSMVGGKGTTHHTQVYFISYL